MEDVKLCTRRSPSLSDFIAGQADKLKVQKEGTKGNKKQTTAVNVHE